MLGGHLMTFMMSEFWPEVIVNLARTGMAYFVTLTDVGMCISGQISFYVRCSWINRYSLRIFFPQYWPRDHNLRKRFFEVSSYARAFARMNYEVADGKFFLEYRVACLRKKRMADNSTMKTVLCKVEAGRANLKTWSVENWWVARPSSQKSEKR